MVSQVEPVQRLMRLVVMAVLHLVVPLRSVAVLVATVVQARTQEALQGHLPLIESIVAMSLVLIVTGVAFSNANSPSSVTGGTGGGGGGCNGTDAAGGGGGEGGYPLSLIAPVIINNGTITSAGGAGAAGATAGAGTGIAGGGGGGGGGCALIYAHSFVGTAPVVSGGSGGAGYNGGSAGAAGSAGNVIYLTNSN